MTKIPRITTTITIEDLSRERPLPAETRELLERLTAELETAADLLELEAERSA